MRKRFLLPVLAMAMAGFLIGLFIPFGGNKEDGFSLPGVTVVEAAPDLAEPILRFVDRNLSTGIVTRVEIYTDTDTTIRFRRFLNDVLGVDRPATTDEVSNYTDYKDTVLTDEARDRFKVWLTWLNDKEADYRALEAAWDGLSTSQKDNQFKQVFLRQAQLHGGLADLLRVIGKHKEAGG